MVGVCGGVALSSGGNWNVGMLEWKRDVLAAVGRMTMEIVEWTWGVGWLYDGVDDANIFSLWRTWYANKAFFIRCYVKLEIDMNHCKTIGK